MKVEIKKSFKGAPEGHTNFEYKAGDIVEGIHAEFVLLLGLGQELKAEKVEAKQEQKPKAKKTPKPKNKKTPKPDHEG